MSRAQEYDTSKGKPEGTVPDDHFPFIQFPHSIVSASNKFS